MSRYAHVGATLLLLVVCATPVIAGVTNPQISILGQPLMSWTDDPENPDRQRLNLDPGETELIFDDYLNPYARGFFTLALGEEGIELEEGFFSLFRGLPIDLGLRGGKYRLPFGRINQLHPHAYPFAERPAVLAAYLPGDEAFNEPALELSRRFSIVGDFSMNAQVVWLQGDTFRIPRESSGDSSDPLENGGDDSIEETRAGVLGRLSGFTMVGDQSAVEFGASATQGTNNVASKARTTVIGVDAKAKLWTSPQAYLLLQGEGLSLDRDETNWDPAAGYVLTSVDPMGGYLYADYNFGIRYNLGASYSRFQEPTTDKPWTQTIGAFVGYALLEESTSFRLDWLRSKPEDGEAINTVTLRAIFSMGPHKAHQF